MGIEEIKKLAEPIAKLIEEKANPYYYVVIGMGRVDILCAEQGTPIKRAD